MKIIKRFLLIIIMIGFTMTANANDENILLLELKKYNPQLLDKERILAVSKSDMLDQELKEEIAKDLPNDISTLFISSVAQQGMTELKDIIWKKLNE